MSTIDQRIVEMKFNYSQFSKGVSDTITALANLQNSLKLDGATKGLENVSAAAGKFNGSQMAGEVGRIGQSFSALQVTAVTALSTIVHRAVEAGMNIAKSLTVAPVMEGLREYETNLNSIQTILANTGLKGAEGLNTVNAALDELNHYSDQTIYNFSEMARNIGTFTAAGVDLDTSTAAIKGIANLAAVSGSNSVQASTAMYQLSQAISAGKVSLEDWNSVVNAGMGGKVFQDSLLETARAHGVSVDDIIKKQGSFRMSLQDGWLSGEILTETLSKFTGDLTADQLKSMGYTEQQIAGILEMGQVATDAATKVKTMSQLFGTLKESATSGWAKTWSLIFGDFDQAKELFTGANNVLGGFISRSAEARNKVIGDWNALGGRTVLIDAISNAFTALISVLRPIGEAFRQIFPAKTGQDLYNMTVSLRDFTASLKPSEQTIENLRRTFAGVFAVLGIGWDILKAVVSTFFRLVGLVTEGSGGFLGFTAKIGDFLVKVREAIHNGDGLTKVFGKLGDILSIPINLLKKLGSVLGSAFNGTGTGAQGFIQSIKDLWAYVEPVVAKIGEIFSGVGDAIASAFEGVSWGDILGTINTGLFAGIAVGLGLLIKKIMGLFDGDGGELFEGIKDSFEQLTDTMQSMQNALRSATLIAIAAAIGVLTLSVVALSKIDSEKLVSALTAMSVMFVQLGGALLLFEKYLNVKDIGKMIGIAAAMSVLGIAVRILASSVKELAELDWQGLAKGLLGLTVMIGVLTTAVNFMPDGKKLFATSLALVVLAGAIKLLVMSVTELSGFSWEEIAKGLTGVSALLLALTLFTRFADADKAGLTQGLGILLLAGGIKLLADAVTDISKLSWENVGKGLAGIAIGLALVVASMNLVSSSLLGGAGILLASMSLENIAEMLSKVGKLSWEAIGKGLTALLGAMTIMSAALYVIPPTAAFGAAGVLVVAMSLLQIGDFLEEMSKLSWEQIGKAMTVLAGTLLIIAGALFIMPSALPGAAALIVVALALKMLAPILQLFSEMTWEEIAKGLLMLAGVFLVIGVAGLLLTPIVPIILLLGVSIGLLGVAMLAAGLGVLAFGAGLKVLSELGAGAAESIVSIVSSLIGLIPLVMEQIGLGLVAFANVIATSGPSILKALTTVLTALLDAIVEVTPKIGETLLVMLGTMLAVLVSYIPMMVDAGMRIIIGILTGIGNNIGKVIDKATDVVVNFVDGLGRNIGRVIDAGVDFIISFVEGLSRAVTDNAERMGRAGADLALAMVEGMIRGLGGLVGRLVEKAKSVALSAFNAAKEALGIASPSKLFATLGRWSVIGMADGLDKYSKVAAKSSAGVGMDIVSSMGKTIQGLDKLIGDDMLNLSPTITPVLDLSSVKRDSQSIGSMLTAKAISIDASYSRASDASAGYQANQDAKIEADSAETTSDVFQFTQNNYSPKALSQAEIYRQTNNQLSVAKGALTNAN